MYNVPMAHKEKSKRMIFELRSHQRDFVKAEASKMERPSMSKVVRDLVDAEIKRRKQT